MDKVICVGKNYLKHAIELGDAIPTEPLYFLKPPCTIVQAGSGPVDVTLPSGEVHHEVELVLEVTGGRFTRYTIGIDLTRRDLQNSLKKAGQPWEKAKVFKNSSILGPWRDLKSLPELLKQPFFLTVNGKLRQEGKGEDMRWGPEFLLKDLPQWWPVCDGDIIYTGTPEGVGPLVKGDMVSVRGPNLEYSVRVI